MSETPERGLADRTRAIAENVEKRYKTSRRVLSFAEYLDLFAADPARHSRDAIPYLRDACDHDGTTPGASPWGEFTRWKLFDLPWEGTPARPGANTTRSALVGQELVQGEIYRAISNFARDGRPNRLVLLHGPNGSAKSTIVSCLMAALENYSTKDEGALYRFHWVFPSQKTIRGSLGFFSEKSQGNAAQSYAHLSDEEIDAKLIVEVRDHPLFLIPVPERQRLLEAAYKRAGATEPPSDWILRGQLSHKSQQVFEALLSSYHGSYIEVLKHVQIERYL